MTEYWKSNAKKYCDVCKCWIADNKVSVQFHENGKRHQENVKKKINELVKKSTKDHKEKIKMDGEMKKMEEEALRAYLKDVESNPDYSSEQFVKEKLKQEEEESGSDVVMKIKEKPKIEENLPKPSPWNEAKTEEGHTYYWNTITNESVWEAPEEGYVSISDQKVEEERQKRLSEEEEKQKSDELRAAAERQKMAEKYKERIEKNKRENEEAAETMRSELASFVGPAKRHNPYGEWTTIKTVVKKEVDLQLPIDGTVNPPPLPSEILLQPEPRVKIKEKTWDKSKLRGDDDGAPTAMTFKKRKFGPQKGNMRSRLDTDD